MKKEMKKAEILEKLQELQTDLMKSPEDYVSEWNEKHPNERRRLTTEDYWPFIVGVATAEIEFILKGGF